jgi:hypothetical protein
MTSSFSMLALFPALVVEGIAIAIALSRWQRHPNVSMLVTVGMILRIGATIGTTVAFPLLHERTSMVGLIYGAGNLVGMVGLALVIAAAFADRPTS